MHSIKIDLAIDDHRWNLLSSITPKLIRKITKACILNIHHSLLKNIISNNIKLRVLLTNKKYIKEINSEFRDIDKSTDVISLALTNFFDSKFQFIGEVFMSYDDIIIYKNTHKILFKERVIHLLIHSILHLFSYNHKTTFGYYIMIQIEQIILRQLKVSSKYIQKFPSLYNM